MTARQHVMRPTPSAPAGDASQANISALVERQRAYFASGETRDPNFRHARLKTLRAVVAACERAVLSALRDDLRKPALEAYASEIGAFRVEVNCAIRNVHEWASPATMLPLLAQFPSRAEIRSEPLGVALIIAPWNYPFGLVMAPLVAALAAGNCITVKPSELAPATSHVIAKLLGDNFDPRHIAVTEGGPEVAQALLNEQFDKIFYTGNARGRATRDAGSRQTPHPRNA